MKNLELMRPKHAYDNILMQREIDGMDFSHKYGGKFVDITCPVCEQEGLFAFEKYGFKHRICENCKTIFCSPRPDDELLALYYKTYKSPQMWTRLLIEADSKRKVLQYEPRVTRVVSAMKERGITKGGNVLDIGCGSGAFVICLKNTGFFQKVIGVDLSEDCVKVCRDKGLEATCGSINDVGSNSIDLICLNDLIEHLPNQFSFLKECTRVLHDSGFIAIATPNSEGFDFKILKNNTKNISPPEHLTYFNPNSLSLLLKRAGFRPVFIETPGKLDVEIVLKEKESGYPLKERNEYIDYLLGKENDILENFQKFISDNRLSSHMLALAQKI